MALPLGASRSFRCGKPRGDHQYIVGVGRSFPRTHGLVNIGENVFRYLSTGSPPFGKENEIDLWPLPQLYENQEA